MTGFAASVSNRSDGPSLRRARGTQLGFGGSARLGSIAFDVRYAEGTLDPSDSLAQRRDVVEGSALVRFVPAPVPWLTLFAGLEARTYDGPSGPERWVTRPAGLRVDTPIVGTTVRGHATLWHGLGLGVNIPPGSGSARGGEVGVTLHLPNGPWEFGLAYGIERAALRDASRRETLEALTFVIRVAPQ